MTDRSADLDRFLAAAGFAGAARQPLPADASFRRYARLTGGPRPALVMDAPPSREDVRPFLHVTGLLRREELSAPEILAADAEKGLVLLEDFGDATFTRLLAAGAAEAPLYGLATNVLVHLARAPVARSTAGVPPYDDGRLLQEARLLVDWFLPAMTGRPASDAVVGDYLALWRDLFPAARQVPEGLVLRDFHVDNLMRLPDRDGVRACGLLDYQDAVRGPVTYDLMSLVEDARRDIAPDLRGAMIDRFRAAASGVDRGAFNGSFAVLAAQRHCKVIGIFTRLSRRDGKHHYLAHVPRVWRLLARHLSHPDLAPLARWLDAHVPADHRGAPPVPENPDTVP